MSAASGESQWMSGGSTDGSQTGSSDGSGSENSGSSGSGGNGGNGGSSTSQSEGYTSPAESTTASATTPSAADSFLTATQTATPSSTRSATATSTLTSSAKSTTSNTKTLAIAIPVAIVGAAIILGLLFFLLSRRRRRRRGRILASTSQVDVVTVPRQPILPQPQQHSPRSLQSAQATPWGLGSTNNTHNIPFTGPIPYSSLDHHPTPTAQSRSLETTDSHHNLTAGIDTTIEQPPPYSTRPEPAGTSIPSTTVMTGGGAPSRQSSRRERPTSPFDHPLDDTVSEISRYSRGPSLVHRASLDEISSVSSMGDDERRPAMRH
ncbi:uncharacterized protein BP01DRAFT_352958 [Aspergillus saccharolyticus JOP 1030-1]|uniref:Uncharacterized protein n=1 Tax=Aspergillus saccharolyticus JOP 1030-1 TaxID=1450539 RepID=A0A318ZPN4_9EURO|nr:hypothetical protein BP01DRAFT_352958 [Aspergillus saccharolyticus JOP 1030-1]PYH49486.1 hypothetical protein BP01DRAFT_352958 [Aspergillus saccharolyticus JOP 1030-1]